MYRPDYASNLSVPQMALNPFPRKPNISSLAFCASSGEAPSIVRPNKVGDLDLVAKHAQANAQSLRVGHPSLSSLQSLHFKRQV